MRNPGRVHLLRSILLPSTFNFLRRLLFVIPFPLSLILLFALPAFSQQKWTKTYGGGGDDEGWSVQQTSDGGYVVAGFTNSFGSNYLVYLVKTNTSGDTLWTRTYGGANGGWGYSVQQTSDGGFIVAGYKGGDPNTDVYLIKTNASGDTLWTRAYGGSGDDGAQSVQQTADGGFIVAGWTNFFFRGGITNVYLVKTDASGNTLWTQTYGETTNNAWGSSVQQTSDGGYIIAGYTLSYGPAYCNVYLIKTNATGDTLWTRTYGIPANTNFGRSVQQTSDGGYIVAGETHSLVTNTTDVYLIKTNASGDTLWTRTYGGTNDDWAWSAQQTSDGGYIIAGYTRSFGAGGEDVYLIKTNPSGDTLWTKTYGGTNNDAGHSVQQTQDGGYIITGYTNSFGAGGYDVYLIKTDANGNVGVESSPSHELRVTSYRVFPNPFTSFATIPGHSSERFTLYDISGRKVGTYKGDHIGFNLSSGVYFLRPETGGSKPIRLVKLR